MKENVERSKKETKERERMFTEMIKQLFKEDFYLLLLILLAICSSLKSVSIDDIVSYCTLKSAMWQSKLQSRHEFLYRIIVCCFIIILKYNLLVKSFR